MYDSIAVVTEEAGGDCEKLGASMTELATKNADLVAAAKALSDADNQAMQDESGADMKATLDGALPAIQKCEPNEKIKAAFDAINL
ncbi:MAG: hypothetical protein GY811_17025 [Myxococcales bacterium]|nr:hypothetical protein [Myxococcales bacterium]